MYQQPLPSAEPPAIQELATQPIWVAWLPVPRPNGKISKIPCDLLLRKLKWGDEKNLRTFDQLASKVINIKGIGGLGVSFLDEGPYCGVDIDGCRNPHTGVISLEAQEYIKSFNSYAEVSPSGTGVHLIMRAKLPADVRNRHGIVEIYDNGRFFTVTGVHIDGTPDTINDAQENLDRFLRKYWPKKDKPGQGMANGELSFDPEAVKNQVKFDCLSLNQPKFLSSWEHSRVDLIDQSLSTYDASLLWFAVFSGWTKQECFDLLIEHRRVRGDGLEKLDPTNRKDYFERTYNAVKLNVQHGKCDTSLAIDELKDKPPEYALEMFYTSTGIRIDDVVLRGKNPGVFYFIMNGEHVRIGGMKELMAMHHVRCVLAEHANIIFGISDNAKIKQNTWYSICELLLKVAHREDEKVLDENFQLLTFVKEYAEQRDVHNVRNWEDAAYDHKPFIKKNRWGEPSLYIHLGDFRKYLNYQCDIKSVNKKLTESLRECKMEYKPVSFWLGKKQYGRGYWAIDMGVLNDATHVPCSRASGDGEDDVSDDAGREVGGEERNEIDAVMQSDEISGA